MTTYIKRADRNSICESCDTEDVVQPAGCKFFVAPKDIPCLGPAHYRLTFISQRESDRFPTTMKLCTFHRTVLLGSWGVSVIKDEVI